MQWNKASNCCSGNHIEVVEGSSGQHWGPGQQFQVLIIFVLGFNDLFVSQPQSLLYSCDMIHVLVKLISTVISWFSEIGRASCRERV